MRQVIKLGAECKLGTIHLGYQKENRVEEFEFDTSIWEERYGAGVLTLAVQRNGDSDPYPKALTDNVWVIEEVDVEKRGLGEFQAEYVVDDKVKESAVFAFFVDRSLNSTGDMPDPYISYFEQIVAVGAQATQDANRAEAAADSIKDLTADATTLPAGSQATAEYDAETGVMTFGIPRGEKGDDGEAGITPNIEVGNVETLETGQPAYANITGTDAEPRLNLGLPKGNTGDTGATGAPAGFGTVTATVDANTGTPSVDVTASGADTAKNFDFAFHNIKGETGEQGPQGDPGVVQDVTVNGTSVLDGAVAKVVIPEITKTVTGNPIVIDDADGGVKALTVELTPIQEGTGTPSPTNIRPISPHTSLPVRDTGKNLFDDTDIEGKGGYWYQNFPDPKRQSCVHMLKAYPNTTYTLSKVSGALRAAVQQYENTSTTQAENPMLNDSGWKTDTYTFTTTADTHYIWVTFSSPNYSYNITASDVQNSKYQLELGDTATSYAPYTGQTVTVPLNDLYGGNVDVIGGESESEWANIASYNGETISEPWLSSMDEYTAGATPTTGAQVVYKHTPTPLTTTPTPLTLYKGDNVISSDGDITLNYERNLQTVITSIENRLSALEG